MYKVGVIIDFAVAFAMIICIIYDVFMGINNHDSYYLILGIIDYIVLKSSIKNIENYIDKADNM